MMIRYYLRTIPNGYRIFLVWTWTQRNGDMDHYKTLGEYKTLAEAEAAWETMPCCKECGVGGDRYRKDCYGDDNPTRYCDDCAMTVKA